MEVRGNVGFKVGSLVGRAEFRSGCMRRMPVWEVGLPGIGG